MLVIKNANVVFTDKIRKAIVLCDNGKIKDIVEHYTESADDNVIDANGLYLSPGFIDIHVHGGGNKSAMSTNYNDIIEMAEAHLKYGTTSIVPTTLAAPIEQLKNVTLSIKEASEKSKKANILGLHYEGPYISLKYKGAAAAESVYTSGMGSLTKLTISRAFSLLTASYISGRSVKLSTPGSIQDWGHRVIRFFAMLK